MKDLRKLSNIWFSKIQQVCIHGTPDILCCIAGRFVAIELKKTPKAPVSRLQAYNLSKIELSGGLAIVAHPLNWNEIYCSLKLVSMKDAL
jgi:hypothetical protein